MSLRGICSYTNVAISIYADPLCSFCIKASYPVGKISVIF